MAERTITITNAEYGYCIEEYDDASKTLIVLDADGDEWAFDCEDGNIIVAGSYDEVEPMRMTLPECLKATKDFFIDWNVKEEVADSIIADLTDWFAEYCISEEEAIQDEIKELKTRIRRRKKCIKEEKDRVKSRRVAIEQIQSAIDGHNATILKSEIAIYEMEKRIAELNEQLTKREF